MIVQNDKSVFYNPVESPPQEIMVGFYLMRGKPIPLVYANGDINLYQFQSLNK